MVLWHVHQPQAGQACQGMTLSGVAEHRDNPVVGAEDASGDLDECGLPDSIATQERRDLTRLAAKRSRLQNLDVAEGLGDLLRVERVSVARQRPISG